MTTSRWTLRRSALLAVCLLVPLAVAGCGDSRPARNGSGGGKSVAVVPVKSNPIDNTATAPGLKIESVLVENNVNPDTGKDAADHLEIKLRNTGSGTLTGFEVYYLIKDPTDNQEEGYYTRLKSSFTIDPDAARTVHFDDTGSTDHYPENPYSLYRASKNAMTVDVTVSAEGVAPQSASASKDAGGAENPDE